MLRSDDMRQFNSAVSELTAIDQINAIRILEELAREQSEEFRCRAISGMARISKDRGETLATQLLCDPNPLVRVTAIDFLRRLGSQESGPLLSRLLASDPDDLVRSWAAFALGQIADASALSALERAVREDPGADHEGRPIREIAAKSIKSIQSRLAQASKTLPESNRVPRQP